MDYDVLESFTQHPGFELYNAVINSQINDFRAKLEAIDMVNPTTGKRYTEVEYEVMRFMINNLREIQNAPLVAFSSSIYEQEEVPEQEIVEKECEEVVSKINTTKKLTKVCKNKHTAAKA